MTTRTLWRATLAIVCAAASGTAFAQFPQLVTDFEQSGEGVAYPIQKASLGDLQVVLFQDPAQADVTFAWIKPDSLAIYSNGDPNLPSTEESFVAQFANFFGANGSAKFLDIRFQWTNPADPTRWALMETLQSPTLGDPSLHLGGKVKLYLNLPNCAQYEYPGLVTPATEIGVALLIAETGNNVPQGFQDFGIGESNVRYEFVGVSSVSQADPNVAPVPVPSRFIPVTDAFCEGLTTGPSGHWRPIEFNLPTESVIGWTARGGNGSLNAADLPGGINRGVLAGIILAVRQTDVTSDFVEVLLDRIEFEAPVTDPASAPSIAGPLVANNTTVKVNDVVSRATDVTLQIDRADGDPNDAFVVDETYSVVPTLTPTSELHFVNFTVPALAINDRVRARQSIGADVGPFSGEAKVNPPAAFSATLSLDEAASLGTIAAFEWVGATAVIGSAGTQGHPVFPQNGVWQKLEFSLIPGIEPVISFAGGNGQLEPDGQGYNIDAMFFTIDPTSPSTGRYDIFLDHIYYIDANDQEKLISDSETSNPFPNIRGQSTSTDPNITAPTSIISGLASYDGTRSNRLAWSFPNTLPSNTHAPYRPLVVFPDTAKAVGMWLLVEDPRLADPNTLPLPAVETSIIGAAPQVTVNGLPPTATVATLFVNGVAAGSAPTNSQASVNITPSVTIAVGNSVSANYSTAARATSDLAYARVSQRPAAPTVQSSLVAGMTTVTVNGILNTGNAVASQVRLFADNVQIGSVNPLGQASVTFNVNPALSVGQQITARQTVNTAESIDSPAVAVGTGDRIRIVINEFQYEDAGTDDREFIELYNAEFEPVDISGWKIRCSDGTAPPNDSLADYTIPANTILAAGDYYVMGHAVVPNVDQVLGTGNLFADGRSATEVLDQNGVVVDTLITERNAGTLGIGNGEGHIWGNFQSQNLTPQSLSRWFDGFDTDDNGRDFGIVFATPGTSNNRPSLAPYTGNFDGAVGTDPLNWIGSFVLPKIIDPTTVSTYNLNVIPASPQGGNAMTSVDTSGGGNGGALDDAARFAFNFSCSVYIDAGNPGFVSGNTTSEYEAWTIGFGLIDQLHNAFHLSGSGNTGLCWQFLKLEDQNTGNVLSVTLQFVNKNNGGSTSDQIVLLDVPSQSLTTGWHTLTISRNYENVSASFDAHTYNGVVPDLGPAALGVAYREFIVGFPATLRPPTIDGVSITVPAAPPLGACCLGAGCQVVTSAICAAWNGTYEGNGTICDVNACLPDPEGACCFPDGSCTVTTEAACTGAWQGEGTNCSPNLCPQPPTGACCVGDVCSITTEAACTGTWEGAGTDCDPNPCVQICLGDADCDGDVDFFDIDPFVAKLGCPGGAGCDAPCPWQNSDVDEDGDVDFFDIDPFVAQLGSTCP